MIFGDDRLVRNGTLYSINSLVPKAWKIGPTHDINNSGVILADAAPTVDANGYAVAAANRTYQAALLVPVAIVPDVNMAGVFGDMVPSSFGSTGQKHFVSPKSSDADSVFPPPGRTSDVVLKMQMAAAFQSMFVWSSVTTDAPDSANHGQVDPEDPTKFRVRRDVTGKTVVRLMRHPGGTAPDEEVARLNVWVVWASCNPFQAGSGGNSTPYTPSNKGPGVYDENKWWGTNGAPGAEFFVPAASTNVWRFVFTILPRSIVADPNSNDVPKLNGTKNHNVPGAGNQHVLAKKSDGTPADRDSAEKQWDVSRKMFLSFSLPNGISEQDLINTFGNNWGVQGTHPSIYFTNLDAAEGSDDPPLLFGRDEDDNPYNPLADNSENLAHLAGELSSCDAPAFGWLDHWGSSAGQTFSQTINFQEFVRLEIWDGKRADGRFWFRISDYTQWHHAMNGIWTVPQPVGNRPPPPPGWSDNGSSSNLGSVVQP